MENAKNNEQTNQQLNGNNSFTNDQDKRVINLNLPLSKQKFEQIKAGAFYNNYSSLEDFVIDVVTGEIEADKQRYLKNKEAIKGKK